MNSPSAPPSPVRRAMAWARPIAPGLGLALVVAVGARLAGQALAPVGNEALLAIVGGVVAANGGLAPPSVKAGARFASQRVLRLGVILLGARLSFGEVIAIGAQAIVVIVGLMALGLAVAVGVGRAAGLSRRLAVLIGVGTAVCGNSAIVATAPVVQADDSEVSYAVATITLFGALAVLLYPVIGVAVGLADATFGLWAGTAINDTSQVVAAAAAYSAGALTVATVVKLTRNALMAPVIVGIAWWFGRGGAAARAGVVNAVPLFVLGFLALVGLRSLDLIPSAALGPLDELAKACILLALAGVGLSTRIADLRRNGARPLLVGLVAAACLAGSSFVVSQWVGGGR
ncbi:MAG: putative sulfate exporter family transporter [Dehalococcoidia bacterium]|nr:putative sulfate exporter family transporter [Dehalococcoidia bacterium]